MEPKDWITIFSVSATVIISIVTIILNRRREKDQRQWDYKLKKEQEEREDKLRKEQQKREDELLRRDRQRDERLRRIERVHTPHIEFNIECNSYGPESDEYILEVLLSTFKQVLDVSWGCSSPENQVHAHQDLSVCT